MIATDDRHPLRSRSIHQNAANCMTIRFRYIAQPRGVRKTYCARSRNDVRRLTSRSNGMPSKKIMESLRTFVFVETVLRRGRMLQGSTEFRILYFIMLNKKNSERLTCLHSAVDLEVFCSFFYYNGVATARSEQDLVQV